MMKLLLSWVAVVAMCACVEDGFSKNQHLSTMELAEARFVAQSTSKTDLLQLSFRGEITENSRGKFFFIKNPSKEILPFSLEHRAITKLTRISQKNTVVLSLDGLEMGAHYGVYLSEEDGPLRLLWHFTKKPRQKILTHNLGPLKSPLVQPDQRLFLFTLQNGAEISPISQVTLEEEHTNENILPKNTLVTFSKNILQIVLPKKPLSDPPFFKEGTRYRLCLKFARENFFDEEIEQVFQGQNKP